MPRAEKEPREPDTPNWVELRTEQEDEETQREQRRLRGEPEPEPSSGTSIELTDSDEVQRRRVQEIKDLKTEPAADRRERLKRMAEVMRRRKMRRGFRGPLPSETCDLKDYRYIPPEERKTEQRDSRPKRPAVQRQPRTFRPIPEEESWSRKRIKRYLKDRWRTDPVWDKKVRDQVISFRESQEHSGWYYTSTRGHHGGRCNRTTH